MCSSLFVAVCSGFDARVFLGGGVVCAIVR